MTIHISEQAKAIYQKALICNLALGFEPEIDYPNKWEVLKEYHKAGFHYISLHVATDATSLETTIQYIASVKGKLKENKDYFILAKTPHDILTAQAMKKTAIGLVFQGTNPIYKSLDMLALYQELGVQSMILSYNIRNAIGDGCAETTNVGLSKFGRKVITRMNQVGILVDCSHTGVKTSLEAMEQSTAPVIFSHSNVYNIHPHPRNLSDEQIKACATIGGVIGINGIGSLLGDDAARPEKYMEHIDYIANLLGNTDHIAIGTDEIYFPEMMEAFLQNNSVMYPQDYTAAIWPKNQWNSIRPKQLIEIVELLLLKGYAENDIFAILGQNYLRVLQQVSVA